MLATDLKDCESCAGWWAKRNKPPRKLHPVPLVNGDVLEVCEWCDGPTYQKAMARQAELEDEDGTTEG